MAFDSFAPNEYFPAPIERTQEQIVISETRTNVDLVHFLQDFPQITNSLQQRKNTLAFSNADWTLWYAVKDNWDGMWTYATAKWSGTFFIKLVGKSKFILKPYEDFVMLSKFVKPYVLNLT